MTTPIDRYLAAALVGLFAAGCSGGEETTPTHQHDEPTNPDPTTTPDTTTPPTTPTTPATTAPTTTGPVVLSVTIDKKITFAQFDQECTKLGGVLQTHAVCAGNNACAGLSFNKFSKEMMEHTCKGMNSCGGISCVVLPVDQGRDAETIYMDSCGLVCHSWEDPAEFMINAPAAADPATAIATYQARSDAYHLAMVAFGRHGVSENGVAAADMPAFHEQYSRAELEGMLEHVRTLTPVVVPYTVVGVDEDMNGSLPL